MSRRKRIKRQDIWRIFNDALDHWDEPEPGTNKSKGQAALELMQKRAPAEYVRAQRMIARRIEEQENKGASSAGVTAEDFDNWLAWMKGLQLQNTLHSEPGAVYAPISRDKSERSRLSPSVTAPLSSEPVKPLDVSDVPLRPVWIELQRPSEGFEGRILEGRYAVKDGTVILAAPDSKPLTIYGREFRRELKPGDDAATIAKRLLREMHLASGKRYPRPLRFQNAGIY